MAFQRSAPSVYHLPSQAHDREALRWKPLPWKPGFGIAFFPMDRVLERAVSLKTTSLLEKAK